MPPRLRRPLRRRGARNVHYLSGFDSKFLWNWAWVAFAIYLRDPQRPATLVCSGLDLLTQLEAPA